MKRGGEKTKEGRGEEGGDRKRKPREGVQKIKPCSFILLMRFLVQGFANQ